MFTKKILTILMLISLSPFVLSQTKDAPHKYIGVKYCGMCHHKADQGNQLKIWENSKHAQAYKTLETKEADEIAKKQGFKTPAIKTPKCLKCHVPAYDVDPKLIEKNYKMEQGVQCETCHGPGSDYKSISVMKNKKEAIAKGLTEHSADMEKFCTTCHNSESPNFKGFDLKTMWAKIKHDIPKK